MESSAGKTLLAESGTSSPSYSSISFLSSPSCCLHLTGDQGAGLARDILYAAALEVEAAARETLAALSDVSDEALERRIAWIEDEVRATLYQVEVGEESEAGCPLTLGTVQAAMENMEQAAMTGIRVACGLWGAMEEKADEIFRSNYTSPLQSSPDGPPDEATLAFLKENSQRRHRFHGISDKLLPLMEVVDSDQKAASRFKLRQLQMWATARPFSEQLLFMAVPKGGSQIKQILKYGSINLCRCIRNVHGMGIYLSDSPLAFNLTDRDLLVCRVLLGRVQAGGSLDSFGQNHEVADSLELDRDTVPDQGESASKGKSPCWRVYAILDPDQVMPYCLLRLRKSIPGFQKYDHREHVRRRCVVETCRRLGCGPNCQDDHGHAKSWPEIAATALPSVRIRGIVPVMFLVAVAVCWQGTGLLGSEAVISRPPPGLAIIVAVAIVKVAYLAYKNIVAAFF